jgi:hypothetical protein
MTAVALDPVPAATLTAVPAYRKQVLDRRIAEAHPDDRAHYQEERRAGRLWNDRHRYVVTDDGEVFETWRGESFLREPDSRDGLVYQPGHRAGTGVICRCGCRLFRLAYGSWCIDATCAHCGAEETVYSG